jgi:hypothetical protein
MNTTVKLQVPMDKAIRDQWEQYAHRNGFDSLQAYIRFLAKADVDGRRVNLEETVRLSPEADARYTRLVAELEAEQHAGKAQTFTSAEDFLKDL